MTTTRLQVWKIGLLILAVYASGCSEIPASGETTFAPFMSPEDEARIGKREHTRIVAQHGGIYAEPQLQAYLNGVGHRIVRASGATGQTFRFTILDSTSANAFALPGGYIYVTRGLLVLLGDEAALAGILAHEVAHVTARHTAKEFSRETAGSLSFMFLSILTVGLSEIVERGAKYYFRTYTRDQEREADTLGLTYLRDADYDPQGLSRGLERMREYNALIHGFAPHQSTEEDDWLATHPTIRERLATLENSIAGSPAPPSARVGRNDYLDQIDRLPVFFHPRLGPARIRIVRAGQTEPGEDRFSDPRIPDGERWAKVLNDINAAGQLQPDDRIKIIAFDGWAP